MTDGDYYLWKIYTLEVPNGPCGRAGYFKVPLSDYFENHTIIPVDKRREHLLPGLGLNIVKRKPYIPGDKGTEMAWVTCEQFFARPVLEAFGVL